VGRRAQTKTADSLETAVFSAFLAMGRAGIEPATHGFSVHCSTNINADSTKPSNTVQNHLSPDLSLSVKNHPQLADLIRAWPSVPEALRAGILAMVKSAK
jgi:hypothetical protein